MKKFFLALMAAFLLPFSACFPAQGGTIAGKVVSIADGDTLTILTDAREQIKIRLYGIDCPEKRQAFGSKAKDFTARQLAGRRVSVEAIGRDRYGRVVGIVRPEGAGESINEQLLKAGLAWVYTKYCTLPQCAQWQRMEQDARANRKGLFQDKNALPPWQWRRAKK